METLLARGKGYQLSRLTGGDAVEAVNIRPACAPRPVLVRNGTRFGFYFASKSARTFWRNSSEDR